MKFLVMVAVVAACSQEPTYRSNFASVRLGERIVDAKTGEPWSGKLVARDQEIAQVAESVLGAANFEHARQIETTGLVLVLPVENGAPDGVARLLVDLNAPKLHKEVAKRSEEALALGRAVSPTLPLAEATFKAGKLDGTAKLFAPGKTTTIAAELQFKDHVIHGAAIEYYPGTKQKLRELQFESGVQTGPARWYYANGMLKAQGQYAGGKLVGKYESWYPNKQKHVEIVDGVVVASFWSNGQPKDAPPSGVIEEWYPGGERKARTTYVNGVKHGEEKRWYKNGKDWELATYDMGTLVGPYRKWWKNGKPAHEYTYKSGRLEGDYKQHYDNGKKWVLAKYVDGKPQGKIERWFPDGKLGYVMEHEGGRPHGVYKRWWPNGKPRLEATYVRGQLDGEFKNWLEDGSVYEFATYARGVKVKTTRPESPPRQP